MTKAASPSRHAVEPVVSRLCEDGDRGPRPARPGGRGDGAPLGLGEGERRGRGELQAPAPGVGDGPHQHSWLPQVWRERPGGRRRGLVIWG